MTTVWLLSVPTPLELMLPLMLLSNPTPNSTFQRYPEAGWASTVEAVPIRQSAARKRDQGEKRMTRDPFQTRLRMASGRRHGGGSCPCSSRLGAATPVIAGL